MQTQVTEAGPFEKILTLQIEEPELERHANRAAQKLSKELKIKGFRPGKAPRPIVERMVGKERLRSEAIEEALPELVTHAIEEAELAPVVTPRVDEIRDSGEGAVEVDVRITMWPKLDEVPEYAGREIVIEAPEVTDEEIDQQIDRYRMQFAELVDVSRVADEGDFVLINLTALDGGQEIPEASASDLLYEVGSRSFIPGLDELLVGAEAGNIKEGPATLPEGFGDAAGKQVTLRVLVKGVKARQMPELTDEWVQEVSEFETVEELREQVREAILAAKRDTARRELRERIMDVLIEEANLELPEALVEAEMEANLHDIVHRLEAQGIDLGNYLRITGQSQEDFVGQLRENATRALSARVILEAVAEEEGLFVEDGELESAVAALAASAGRDPADFAEALRESGQEQALIGDILRSKAIDHLIEAVRPVDAQGEPIDVSVIDVDDDTTDDTAVSVEDEAEERDIAAEEPEPEESSTEESSPEEPKEIEDSVADADTREEE